MLLVFSILWLDLVRMLSYTWETREQYSYGWFVPMLAMFLLAKRWTTRPDSSPRQTKPLLAGIVIAGISLILVPMRVIFEINADWPLIAYVQTALVIGASLFLFYLAGGFPWVRHFLFPTAFILIAVAWPDRIEKTLTQGLMQIAAGLTVEILGLLGIPALQQGNLIEVGTGVLGVDEACSGIRSFQSTLMAGLLMGELYRFRLGWRLGLVAIGLSMAFAFNVVRTLILSWVASRDGVAAVDKWHDSAGFSIAIACFFFLWLLAIILKRRSTGAKTPVAAPPDFPRTNGGKADPWLRRALLGFGVAAMVSLAATEIWYRSNTSPDSGVFQWAVKFPINEPGYRRIEFPPAIQAKLGHDAGGAFEWTGSHGEEWNVYFLRWSPRSARSALMARVHRPEVCLPANGLRQIGDSQVVNFSVQGLQLPFRSYTYETQSRTVHVFFCEWEDGTGPQAGLAATKQAGRIRTVLNGKRRVGLQTLEVLIYDSASMDEALARLRGGIERIIEPNRPAVAAQQSPSRADGSRARIPSLNSRTTALTHDP